MMSDVMLDLGSDRHRTSFTGNLTPKLFILKIQMDHNRTVDYTGTIYPTCNPSNGFTRSFLYRLDTYSLKISTESIFC